MEQTNKEKLYLCASKYGDYQMINSYLLAIFLSKESQHCDGCSKKSLHSFINFPKKKKTFFIYEQCLEADGDSSFNVHLIPKEGLESVPNKAVMSLPPNQTRHRAGGGRFLQHLLKSLLSCNLMVLRAMCRRPNSLHAVHQKASKRDMFGYCRKKIYSFLKL